MDKTILAFNPRMKLPKGMRENGAAAYFYKASACVSAQEITELSSGTLSRSRSNPRNALVINVQRNH